MASNALAVLVWVGALVAMLAFVLLQGWRERAAQRARQRQPTQPIADGPRAAPLTGAEAWGRVAQEVAAPRVVAPVRRPLAAPARPSAPLARRRSLRFRARSDLRHAIVANTVLGPCRAQEPWQEPDRRP